MRFFVTRPSVAMGLLAGMLVACNGSTDGDGGLPINNAAGFAQPPATGKGCLGPYGNSPRPMTSSADGLLAAINLCKPLDGEVLNWTDHDGTPRYACLSAPPTASQDAKLPMLVWLHPAFFPIDTIRITDIFPKQATADLSGDPARPGFILLLPAGRDIQHYYPAPYETGLGWDNWYRNFDRNDPDINVDVAAIDHFIQVAKQGGVVDDERIYLSGWSNGSAMAILYGLNTPGIAATAVYSAPNPFGEHNDPCPQAAFGNNLLPIYHVHNDCDILGICPGGERLFAALLSKHGTFQNRIIDGTLQPVNTCNALCNPGQPLGESLGTANHARWPYTFTDEMLAFLRAHPKNSPRS